MQLRTTMDRAAKDHAVKREFLQLTASLGDLTSRVDELQNHRLTTDGQEQSLRQLVEHLRTEVGRVDAQLHGLREGYTQQQLEIGALRDEVAAVKESAAAADGRWQAELTNLRNEFLREMASRSQPATGQPATAHRPASGHPASRHQATTAQNTRASLGRRSTRASDGQVFGAHSTAGPMHGATAGSGGLKRENIKAEFDEGKRKVARPNRREGCGKKILGVIDLMGGSLRFDVCQSSSNCSALGILICVVDITYLLV